MHTTCASTRTPGRTSSNPARASSTACRAPPRLGARPPGYFYGLDGLVRLAPSLTTREQASAWVDYNGPVSPGLIEAVCASDADVMAFYPYMYHPTWPRSERCRRRRCSILPPTTSRRCTCRCSGARSGRRRASASTPPPNAPWWSGCTRWPTSPRSSSGSGVGESQALGRPGGRAAGTGGRPYIVSVGRVDEHKGSKMLAHFFAAYKERHPGPAGARPGRARLLRTAGASRHRGDGSRRRAGQVGHRARLAGGGLALRARVLLAGRRRGLGRPGTRSGQRGAAGRPGSTASARGAGCGSRPIPSSRWCSTGCWPTPCCGRPGRARPRLRGHATSSWPVLIDALRRGSSTRWWSEAGEPQACSEHRRASCRRVSSRVARVGRGSERSEPVMPTMGWLRCWPPIEPRNGASP